MKLIYQMIRWMIYKKFLEVKVILENPHNLQIKMLKQQSTMYQEDLVETQKLMQNL